MAATCSPQMKITIILDFTTEIPTCVDYLLWLDTVCIDRDTHLNIYLNLKLKDWKNKSVWRLQCLWLPLKFRGQTEEKNARFKRFYWGFLYYIFERSSETFLFLLLPGCLLLDWLLHPAAFYLCSVTVRHFRFFVCRHSKCLTWI